MILNADARHIPLASGIAQMVITSPPYFNLRDYGTGKWEGGDPACNHSPARTKGQSTSTITGGQATNNHAHEPYIGACRKCGARRIDHQIGIEASPEEYVYSLVLIMRECWRVLRDDGILWLNIGDTYVSNPGDRSKVGGMQANPTAARLSAENIMSQRYQYAGLKKKDLIGIPWMVAFALRADGWYLRSEIIWNKTNGMSESVTDRPTNNTEKVFLLSKRARYYYDNEAIKTPSKNPVDDRGARTRKDHKRYPTQEINGIRDSGVYPMANKRCVWTISTQPSPYPHYAVMPELLAEPCILAGSRPGDLVFDPFAGSGTTAKVALRHGRRFVGTELNYGYIRDIVPVRLKGLQVELPL